jgi:hypothetical protein
MKGRRKVSTSKWFLKAKFEAEAQQMSVSRSKNVANRFLDAALQFGAVYEPTGRLAGGLYASGQVIYPTPQRQDMVCT